MTTKTWANCEAILQAWTSDFDLITDWRWSCQFILVSKPHVDIEHHVRNKISRRHTFMVSRTNSTDYFPFFIIYIILRCSIIIKQIRQSLYFSGKLNEDFKLPKRFVIGVIIWRAPNPFIYRQFVIKKKIAPMSSRHTNDIQLYQTNYMRQIKVTRLLIIFLFSVKPDDTIYSDNRWKKNK